jgi:hypothetical protein
MHRRSYRTNGQIYAQRPSREAMLAAVLACRNGGCCPRIGSRDRRRGEGVHADAEKRRRNGVRNLLRSIEDVRLVVETIRLALEVAISTPPSPALPSEGEGAG